MIKSIFHINVNVKDFDRSLAFYKMVGFKVVLDLGEGPNPANDKGFAGVPIFGRCKAFFIFKISRLL